MGEPRFDRSKRYVNKYGKKIGKGVWYDGDGTMIKPGWGIPNSNKKIVIQYNKQCESELSLQPKNKILKMGCT